MINWGGLPIGSVIPFIFDSFAGATGAAITMTGIAVGDIKLYKNVSMTIRSSTAGFALLDTDGIDLNTTTGIHGFSIDTGDDTDAGFFAAGSMYTAVLASITIDGQTVNFVVGTFRLMAAETTTGMPDVTADVRTWLGAAVQGLDAGGFLEVDLVQWLGTAAATPTIAGVPEVDITHIGGTAVTAAAGIPEVKVANIAANAITATAINADAITAAKLAADVTTELQNGLATAAALATVDGIVDDILVDTAVIGAAGAGLTALATQASVNTIDGIVDAIVIDTAELQTDWADGGRLDLILDARASQTSVNTIDDFLDTEIAAILAAVDTEVAAILVDTNELQTDWVNGGRLDLLIDAIKAKSDLIPGTVDGKTFIAGWTLMMAALLGKASGLETTTAIYRAVDDSKDRITATVDADGNRSAVTLDAS